MFKPVQVLADWIVYGVFGLGRNTLAGGSVNFFIFIDYFVEYSMLGFIFIKIGHLGLAHLFFCIIFLNFSILVQPNITLRDWTSYMEISHIALFLFFQHILRIVCKKFYLPFLYYFYTLYKK